MKARSFFGLLVAAAVMVGCGGNSVSDTSRGPTDQTRERVESMLRSTIRGMSQTGGLSPRDEGLHAGPGMTIGLGGPAPSIGGMIRFEKPPGTLTEGDGGGSSSGGGTGGDPGPGDDGPGFYFDEWLELWVQVDFSSTTYRMDFFEDEAKTRPAGHMASTWPTDWTVYPVTWQSDYEFLAGPFRGSRGLYSGEMTSETTGSMLYDATWDGSRYQGRSTWSESGSSWTNRTDHADLTWSTDRGDFQADGSGSTYSENSHGYRSTYRWRADSSGYGRLEGPDPGLPATLVWDSNGKGTITYANGTVEEFHWWTLWTVEPPPDDDD